MTVGSPVSSPAASSGSSALRRAGLRLTPRQRICAAFFFYAFGMGGIFPRLPAIQQMLGVAEGPFGLALIGAAAGTMVSLSFAGRWIERIGHRRALLVFTALLPLCYAAAAHATDVTMLFALLLPAGLCIGSLEIVVNLEADRVEHQSGRRLMNRAHGFWSLGFFAAGLIGAGMSRLGLTPQMHLALMVPLVWLGGALLLGGFEPAPARSAVPAAPPARFARPTTAVLLLVAVSLSAMVLEGAGADWSGIYMRDAFGAPPFVSGIAVATGALAQGLTRFGIDGVVERYRPVPVARTLLTLLGLGCALVLAAPSMLPMAPAPWAALAGFALMGVGTSAIFPLAMSAAAQRTDRAAATNVAALAQFAFVAFLLGPPLLGTVAQVFGIRWAFGVCLPLVAISLLTAGALRAGDERRG